MNDSVDCFELLPGDNRLIFNYFSPFSFYEKIENAFINNFLQKECLKAAVLDFPLMIDVPFNSDEGETPYFYEDSKSFGKSYYNENFSEYSDCLSEYGFHSPSLSQFQRFHKDESRKDLNSENYQGESLNNTYHSCKEEIVRQTWENNERDFGQNACLALPLSLTFLGGQSDGIIDMVGGGVFSEKAFEGERINDLARFWKSSSDSSGGKYGLVQFGNYENSFEKKSAVYRLAERYAFDENGTDFANVSLWLAFHTGVSASDTLVQPVGNNFVDNTDLMLQGRYELFFNRKNEIVAGREKDSFLETENKAAQRQEKVFSEEKGHFEAAKLLAKKNQAFAESVLVFERSELLERTVQAVERTGLLERIDQAVKRPDMFSDKDGRSLNKLALESVRIEGAYKSLCGFFSDLEKRAFGYAHIAGFSEAREILCKEDLHLNYGNRLLMPQKENLLENKLYFCKEDPGELHISLNDVRKALRTEVSEYFGEPVKAEIKVDMSGMKNIINKETSIDSIVTDLTAAISEAVTSVAEGVHNL